MLNNSAYYLPSHCTYIEIMILNQSLVLSRPLCVTINLMRPFHKLALGPRRLLLGISTDMAYNKGIRTVLRSVNVSTKDVIEFISKR